MKCSRLGCEAEATTRLRQYQHYCDKHYRLNKMRSGTYDSGKATPSIEDLEAMVPADMCCTECGKTMQWRSLDGKRGDTMSLQHWDDGTMSIICHHCNTQLQKGNVTIPPAGHKRCSKCGEHKLFSEFYPCKRGYAGLQNQCKICKLPSNAA